MDENILPARHAAVWTALKLLDDNQRMTGAQLMEHSGIKDRRLFYQIIRDLRRWGYPVGSSKQEGKQGYYEARTQEQLEEAIKGLTAMIADFSETIRAMETSITKDKVS